MKPKHAHVGLAVLGTVLPAWQIAPFLHDHGLAFGLFFQQLFSTPIGGFFGMDVFVSSMVLWVLLYVEGRRAGVRHRWLPVVANLTVGVSLALPLFLYMREVRLHPSSR